VVLGNSSERKEKTTNTENPPPNTRTDKIQQFHLNIGLLKTTSSTKTVLASLFLMRPRLQASKSLTALEILTLKEEWWIGLSGRTCPKLERVGPASRAKG
jgi:hypothetical protein